MDNSNVLAAAEQCRQFLLAAADADWTARIPDMEWTVAQAVAHAAEVPLWYSLDLSAGGPEVDTIDLKIKQNRSPAELVATLGVTVRILTAVLTTSPPESRGFHSWGAADPSGYAAMACDELLIHTDDAARGLGLQFEPDPELCARVLARLFPDAPAGLQPWDGLRWANGRLALPGLPRREKWRWYSSPLEEQQPR